MSNCRVQATGLRIDDVWAVLADPHRYAEWVVGAKEVQSADKAWPAAGAALQHVSGVGPVEVKDETVVLAADPPRRMVLRAHLQDLGTAEVTMQLDEQDGVVAITMTEQFIEGPPSVPVLDKLTDAPLHLRNDEALRRLVALAGGKVTNAE